MSEILDSISSIDVRSFAPAMGAVALSLKNWLDLRKGASIKPLPLINYGLWAIKGETSRNKVLLLPLIFKNDGVKDGIITSITVAFARGSDFVPVEIRRRIKLKNVSEQEIRNMNLAEFRNKGISSVHPLYPIEVGAHGSTSIMIEAFDGSNVIPVGDLTGCKITITQGNGKSNEIRFPFQIVEETFDETVNNLTWVLSS